MFDTSRRLPTPPLAAFGQAARARNIELSGDSIVPSDANSNGVCVDEIKSMTDAIADDDARIFLVGRICF